MGHGRQVLKVVCFLHHFFENMSLWFAHNLCIFPLAEFFNADANGGDIAYENTRIREYDISLARLISLHLLQYVHHGSYGYSINTNRQGEKLIQLN